MINEIKEAAHCIEVGSIPVLKSIFLFILIMSIATLIVFGLSYLIRYHPFIILIIISVISFLVACYFVGKDKIENE